MHDRGFGWGHHRLAAKEMTAKGDTKAVKSKEETSLDRTVMVARPRLSLTCRYSGPTEAEPRSALAGRQTRRFSALDLPRFVSALTSNEIL